MRTLITGASSGLGEGMARELAAAGTTSRSSPGASTVSRPCARSSPPRASGSPSPPSTSTTTTRSSRRSGRCATSSAGSTAWSSTPGWARARRSAPDASMSTWRRRAPTSSPPWRSARPRWRSSARRTPGTSSSCPRWPPTRGLPGAQTTYAATKAGLSHLAEGIRVDVADTPIRVTTLAPGYIRTDLNGGMSRPFSVDAATGPPRHGRGDREGACLRLRADVAVGGPRAGAAGDADADSAFCVT